MTGGSGFVLADESGAVDRSQWAGVARVLGPSWARLPSLTVSLVGVQVLWSVEMSYASPYLVSLGLSRSWMAAVFLAGPLSGLLVQPMIGVLADNSKSRFGRRRPILLAGTVLCCCATLLLGYTKPVASLFTAAGSSLHTTLTIWLAVFAIYCMDFSINAVMGLDRALIVDTLPASEQPDGNSWAALMVAVGSVAGFYIGNIDLPALLPFFGSVQIEVLCAIVSFLLFGTQLWTSWCVKERILLATHGPPKTLLQEMAELAHTLLHLPRVIRQICIIQAFAWMAWFPVLFYTSLYVGELYKRSLPGSSDDVEAEAEAEAARLGSRALFYSALISLVSNLLAPMLVASRFEHGHEHESPTEREKHSLARRWWAMAVRATRMHLATLWAVSHAVFAACMGATLFATSVASATFVMSLTGFCWAITQWAPFALLGEAILSHSSTHSSGADAIFELDDTTMELEVDAELIPIHRRHGHRGWESPHESEDERASGMEPAEAEEGIQLSEGHADHGEDGEENSSYPARDGGAEALFDADLDNGDGDDDEKDHYLGAEEHARLMGGRGGEHTRLSASRLRGMHPHAYSRGQGGSRIGRGGGGASASSMNGPSRGKGLSAQAGTILGIHNIAIVVPQFVVTAITAIIFALLDPAKSVLHAHHPGGALPIGTSANRTAFDTGGTDNGAGVRVEDAEGVSSSRPNAIVVVFQLGGIAAAVAFVLTCRLARELKRREAGE